VSSEPQNKQKPENNVKDSFFQRIISAFTGKSDPEREKRKLLKQIEKTLKKQRVKFYNPRPNTVHPRLAQFFYEFYRVLGPAQNILTKAETSKSLQMLIIETSLTDDQVSIQEQLSEEAIRKRLANSADQKIVFEQIRTDIKNFFSDFDINRVNEIDSRYNNTLLLLDLIHFDYYFLLKKFDSAIPENDYLYKPHFEEIDAEYIADDLKDFLEIIPSFNASTDWNSIITMLNQYRGIEIISEKGWKKILTAIRQIQRTGIITMLVQLITKDPFYKPSPKVYRTKVVESYLEKLKTQTEITIQRIIQEKRTSKIGDLTNYLFGTASVVRLKNYSDKANIAFTKLLLGGFSYISPLNYLKAFLLDYVKKDIRELIDLLLIKGKWASNLLSQQLSESYHQLLKISDEINEFDASLDEEEILGRKLKSVLVKTKRDKKAIGELRNLLKEINDMAKGMLNRSASNLITLGKALKTVLDDYQKPHAELIINWKEIGTYSDKDIKVFIVNIYKKIYTFLQLLKLT